MLNYFHVPLPVQVMRSDVKFPLFGPRKHLDYFRVGIDVLTEEFVSWSQARGFRLQDDGRVHMFYAYPGAKTSVHQDVLDPNGWALNVALGPSGLRMTWNSVGIFNDATAIPKRGADYFPHPDDSPVIDSVVLTSHACRIGVPHQAINDGPPVWLASIRMAPWYPDFDELRKMLT